MSAIAGLRGTGNWGTDERPKNFREMILWRDPNGSAPLTALMSKMRKDNTDDPEFAWWEEELKAIRVQVGAAAVTAATTITLSTVGDAAALDLVAGDVLLVESTPVAGTYGFEVVEVTTTPTASNSVVLTRGAANTTPASIASGAFLLKIGSAFEEGSPSPDSSTRNPTKYRNYSQIFKTTYDLTNTTRATTARTGDAEKNDKKRKMFDHAVAMEQAFLFNPTAYETTGASLGKPKRYTGGLMSFLAAAYNATSKPTMKIWTTTAVTEDDILDATHGMWDYNVPESGTERIALAGNGFLNYLNKIAKDSSSTRINYDGVVDVYGMKLTRWIMPQGTIYVRTHPLMNTNSRFTNGCFIVNPPGVRYRPLQGRDTKFQDNIQANDADRKKGQWITEAGVEFHHLGSMRYLGIHV